eukprot:jgi/Tetstr1/429774/TSEL_019641.t1
MQSLSVSPARLPSTAGHRAARPPHRRVDGGVIVAAAAVRAPRVGAPLSGAGALARSAPPGRPPRSLFVTRAASAECPSSREEAIAQAVGALSVGIEAAAGLRPGRRGRGKGKGQSRGNRLSVEVPVADESAASTVELVRDIVDGLFKGGEIDELTVVFADFEAAKASLKASLPAGVDVDYLEEAAGKRLRGSVMIVQPGEAQVELVAELMGNWSGGVAVMLNPGWDPFKPPSAQRELIASFQTVYSFLPVAMKIFVKTVEGAVFKLVDRGDPADTPWQIFQLQGGALQPIGRQAERPSNENLEIAFANASAASSPLRNLNPFKKS